MKKLALATAIAAGILGAQAFAQDAKAPSTTTPSATTPSATSPSTTSPSTTTADKPAMDKSVDATPKSAPAGVNYYSKTDGAWRASKLIGVKVMNAAGEVVGDINEIVLDSSGKATAAVIGVGGFLGLGEHEVAVAFDSLKVARDGNGRATVMLNVTKESLKAAPQWKWAT